MESKTAKLVNEQRVIELLDCYGGDAANWPEEERTAASALIKSTPGLQQRQREAQQLDELMAVAEAKPGLNRRADPAVAAGIMDALPQQPPAPPIDLGDYASRKSSRLSQGRRWWVSYSAVAAAAVMVLAVGVMLKFPVQPTIPTDSGLVRSAAVSQDELDAWLWQQATGEDEMALNGEQGESGPMTFLAMVELDLLPEDE